ncbi:MAG: enoyl-CoA hydratase/isomerase family protein [Bacteroidetes bacterium]|nr:enoyl-CoA hydratase/isomerase family protein [Bacteroidota bacterium]
MNNTPRIILKREKDVGWLQINNPPENYLEQPDFIEIEELKNFIETGIKALVIEGVGRHFSAGADLEKLKEQIKDRKAFQDQLMKGNNLLNYIDELEIPVIAAISGVCFGAGLEIALACDIRICDENVLFAFPEVNHDVFPGLGGAKRLAELTGVSAALELTLSGDMINAEKALELQIIDTLVKKNEAKEYAVDLAGKITDNRPLKVIRAVMSSVNNSASMRVDEQIKCDTEMFVELALESMNKNND